MNPQKELEMFLNELLENIPPEKRSNFIEDFNKLSEEYDKRFKEEIKSEEWGIFLIRFLNDVLEFYNKYKYSKRSNN